MAPPPVPPNEERRPDAGRASGPLSAFRQAGGTMLWVVAVSGLAGALGYLFAEVLSVSPAVDIKVVNEP